jgi:hypothetical protein
MNDKTTRKQKRNVVHEADERQNHPETEAKCRS